MEETDLKKSKKIKNYFTHYELAIGLSAVALIYGVIDWWYGLTAVWFVTGTLGIVLGIGGIILFDTLRVKTDEFDRYVRDRIDRARGAGLFEAEDTFLAYVVEDATHKRVGGDGKLRTERCQETRLRVERERIRMETYALDVLTEQIRCVAMELPTAGAKATAQTEEVNDGKQVFRQTYLTVSAADGRSHRFPVPTNSMDVDQLMERINRQSQRV